MKKIIILSLALMVILAVSLASGIGNATANPFSVYMQTNDSNSANSTATSTAPYMLTSAASTTMAFDPQNGSVLQINLASYSTSTAPLITWTVEFSNNNSDWYPYEWETAPTALTAGAKGDTWSWSAATTTANETVFKSVKLISDYTAKYGRISYDVSSAQTRLHVELTQHKEF